MSEHLTPEDPTEDVKVPVEPHEPVMPEPVEITVTAPLPDESPHEALHDLSVSIKKNQFF